MTYTLQSARFANSDHTAAEVLTAECGHVLMSTADAQWSAVVALNPTPYPAQRIKDILMRLVDDDAERVRLRYITPGAGMAMTYQEKFAQAQAVNALGQEAANALTQQQREASFPTLSASVGIEAATLWACAQLVLTKYAQFAALSKVIEGTRLAGKKAISDASDAASAQAAYEAITWPT